MHPVNSSCLVNHPSQISVRPHFLYLMNPHICPPSKGLLPCRSSMFSSHLSNCFTLLFVEVNVILSFFDISLLVYHFPLCFFKKLCTSRCDILNIDCYTILFLHLLISFELISRVIINIHQVNPTIRFFVRHGFRYEISLVLLKTRRFKTNPISKDS